MTPELIEAIQAALDRGFRVELLKDKQGNVIVQTIQRKRMYPAADVHAPKGRTKAGHSGSSESSNPRPECWAGRTE